MTKKDIFNGNLNELYENGFTISEDETKYLSSWATLSMQIQEAKESLIYSMEFGNKESFEKFSEFVLANAMFKNSILSYSKCFSSSGAGKISMDSNEIYKNEEKFRELHDSLMEIRNKYIAHNDNNEFEISVVLQKSEEEQLTLSHSITYKTPIGKFKKYFELFEYCNNYIIKQLNKKADKIEKRIGRKIGFN